MSTRPLVSILKLFSTRKGLAVPKKFIKSKFASGDTPPTRRFCTVMESGKLTGVLGWIATALLFGLIIRTSNWLELGKPADQLAATSQLPLTELIQSLNCA